MPLFGFRLLIFMGKRLKTAVVMSELGQKATSVVSVLMAVLLACSISPSVRAEGVLMRARTDLLQVSDCPIEKPYAPEPDQSKTTQAEESLFFPMHGYLYKRIQFSGLTAPTDLEIIWTPENPYFPFDRQRHWEGIQPWPKKTAHLSVAEGGPQCFYSWFFSPANVPGDIEVRARGSLAGLKVSFSDRAWDHEGECPARQLCPVLVRYLRQCRSAPESESCNALIDTADRLTSPYQCRRAGDFEPVPAIWVCNGLMASDVLADTMHLLRRLKSAKAHQFYNSIHFRSVLDGYLAEEYMNDPETDRPVTLRAH
jgi:hypothetical protein